MKGLHQFLQKLTKIKALKPFKTVFETLEGILFGTAEVTKGAPHISDSLEIKRYMSFVILALLPATLASIYFFGWAVVKIIAVSYISGGLVEIAFAVIRKRDIEEGFFVTGLIFPLILPPTIPLWVVATGSVFGVFFGKEVFGGTGRNIFNPALVGRLFITIAFPKLMSAVWRAPFSDTITAATPLGLYKTTGETVPLTDLLLGLSGGSLGELFRVGIIAGGIFLMLTKVSNWRIPVTYLASVLCFAFFGNLVAPRAIAPPLFQLFSGGLLFGAMFMTTDPVTSPVTKGGKYIFALFCGLLTLLIRGFSGYTEGVMFSIIFMNAMAPLIDHIVLQTKYRKRL